MILVDSPEELGQRRHVGVQAAEQEAAIALEARHLLQVVAAVLVEGVRVAGAAGVLHLEQLAGVVEGPAVEGAGEAGLVALLVAAQRGAAVRAGVDDGVEFARLVARDDDRLAADLRGEVVVRVGDLALVGQVDPVALEDVLHLQVEQGLVGEGAAVQAVDVPIGVLHQHAGQALLDAFEGCGSAHACLHARSCGPIRGKASPDPGTNACREEKVLVDRRSAGRAGRRRVIVRQAAARGRAKSVAGTRACSACSVKSNLIS